jgi:hypothetical protein
MLFRSVWKTSGPQQLFRQSPAAHRVLSLIQVVEPLPAVRWQYLPTASFGLQLKLVAEDRDDS